MNKTVIRPSISKILLFWLLMSVVVILFVILNTWKEITDLVSFSIAVLLTLFKCFIFSIIFFNLPYFKIEINDTHVIGPQGFGLSWQRTWIPLEDVDLQNIDTRLQWLGFYIVKSKTGEEKLSIWGFDKKQLNKFIDIITNKKASLH